MIAFYEVASHLIVRAAVPEGRQVSALPPGVSPVINLAPGPIRDQVWASDAAGVVRLLQLDDTARVITQLGVRPGAVHDLHSMGMYVSVLRLD